MSRFPLPENAFVLSCALLLLAACTAPESTTPEPTTPEESLAAAPTDSASCKSKQPEASVMNQLYTSADVASYYENETGDTLAAAVGPGSSSVSIALSNSEPSRLTIPLQVGTRTVSVEGVGGVILDTGSAGITVDCLALFSSEVCSASEIPKIHRQEGIYITDSQVTRCYGDGNEKQVGYIAIANITLGTGDGTSVSANMPFTLVTQYSRSTPAGAGLVGIRGSVGGGLVSPLAYLPYGDSLDAGYVLDASGPTLSVGVTPGASGFTTTSLTQITDFGPYDIPSSTASLLWNSSPSSTVTVTGPSQSASTTSSFLLDTGTPPKGGTVKLSCGENCPDCASSDCTVTVAWNGTTVVDLSDWKIRVNGGPSSHLGLGFLLDNSAGNQFLVDLTAGEMGFALSSN